MKKYSSLILALLLIFAVAVPSSLVFAQNGSNFGEIIQRLSNSENFSNQEKYEIMDRAIELHYEDGLTLDQISEILDQNDNYDGIIGQFDEMKNSDRDENENDDQNGDRDRDEDMMDDENDDDSDDMMDDDSDDMDDNHDRDEDRYKDEDNDDHNDDMMDDDSDDMDDDSDDNHDDDDINDDDDEEDDH